MKTRLFHLYCPCFIFGLIVLAQSISAQEITPFHSRNQNPFISIFGLPASESGELVPPGKVETRVVLEVINNYTRDRRSQQQIIIDGETYRTELSLRWGMSSKIEAGIHLPYLTHNPGFLDNFIEDWHNTFGFSNKKRQETEKNQLDYLFHYEEEPLIQVNQYEAGMGDAWLSAGFPLSLESMMSFHKTALRVGLKLPTGNPDTLHGSGNTDLFFSIHASDKPVHIFWPLMIYGGTGLLLLGDSKVFEDHQRHYALFGSIGIGGHFGRWLDLKVQLDAQTAFYRNRSQQLGVFSAQLLMGGTLNLPHQIFLDAGVSEDIIKDTAPDLIFHFALRRQF